MREEDIRMFLVYSLDDLRMYVKSCFFDCQSNHEIRWEKPEIWNGKIVQCGNCVHCGASAFLNTKPAPNETNISGDIFGKSCTKNS